jgi:phosphoribosylcarboxyaminoimidazole (NCAIR) mutase
MFKQSTIATMETHSIDALLAPSAADIPNYCAARGGLPVISVPLGYHPEDTVVKWNEAGHLVKSAPNIP